MSKCHPSCSRPMMLCGGEFGVLAMSGRMKAQNHLLLRYARIQQLLNEFQIRSIVFDPYFPIMDVYMHQRSVNATPLFPAYFQKLVVPVGIIENDLLAHPFLCGGIVGHLLNDTFDDLPITLYPIHRSTFSS